MGSNDSMFDARCPHPPPNLPLEGGGTSLWLSLTLFLRGEGGAKRRVRAPATSGIREQPRVVHYTKFSGSPLDRANTERRSRQRSTSRYRYRYNGFVTTLTTSSPIASSIELFCHPATPCAAVQS